MERIDNILGYKESYKIIQESEEFNFSIDSTILSFFLDIKLRESRIIDLGCGNGIIPLLLSMRTNKEIYGIELEKSSYDRASRSVKLNNLDNQIKIINDDIKNLTSLFKPSSFSLVVSNPPYFRLNDTALKNDNENLKNARHETNITMEEIIKISSYLLTDGGSFNMVQRSERFLESLELLKKYRLVPKRIRFIYPKKNKESYIFLIDSRKNAKEHGLKILDPLYIYDEDGNYTKEVLEYFHYGEKDA